MNAISGMDAAQAYRGLIESAGFPSKVPTDLKPLLEGARAEHGAAVQTLERYLAASNTLALRDHVGTAGAKAYGQGDTSFASAQVLARLTGKAQPNAGSFGVNRFALADKLGKPGVFHSVGGHSIQQNAQGAIEKANREGWPQMLEHWNVQLYAFPGDDPQFVVDQYRAHDGWERRELIEERGLTMTEIKPPYFYEFHDLATWVCERPGRDQALKFKWNNRDFYVLPEDTPESIVAQWERRLTFEDAVITKAGSYHLDGFRKPEGGYFRLLQQAEQA